MTTIKTNVKTIKLPSSDVLAELTKNELAEFGVITMSQGVEAARLYLDSLKARPYKNKMDEQVGHIFKESYTKKAGAVTNKGFYIPNEIIANWQHFSSVVSGYIKANNL
jgi:hypothetical protein